MAPEPWRPVRLAAVDDHEIFLQGFGEFVRELDGFELTATATTVSALIGHLDSVDLVLLDLRLNDGSSPEENVRAIRSRGVDVLIVTGATKRTCSARLHAVARSGW